MGRPNAAEYFVGKGGNDAHDGLSRERAFLTIQKGVDALQPGDTLTIAPGEYSEAVRRDKLGGPDAETVIRAEIPGTVLIRGDVPLPAFRKVEGYRFLYAADFESETAIRTVNDLDALDVYPCLPSIAVLDFRPGSACYDPEAKKVYVSTADFSPAETRRFTASLEKEPGIQLGDAERVRLEGLSVTGFRRGGILLLRPHRCVVTGCRAYLNSRGIQISSSTNTGSRGGENVIERCVAWANYEGLSGNVQDKDTIRDSLAFLNVHNGMRLYAGEPEVSRMHDNLAWGNGSDFFMKSGISRHVVERCVGPGRWPHESGGSHIRHCLIGLLERGPRADLDFLNNIHLSAETTADPKLNLDVEFADPVNHDYRLQATSRFRGAGTEGSDLGAYPFRANIYYVSPKGNDAADGLSVTAAWRTLERASRALRPGDTLYLTPGRYASILRISAAKANDERIYIRGRGEDPPELAGAVQVENSDGITFERLHFLKPVAVSGEGLVFEQCAFSGEAVLSARGVHGLRVVHCAFSGGGTQMECSECSDLFLTGNRFENVGGAAVEVERPEAVLYSDYNAYRAPARAWRVGGKDVGFDRLPGGWERYGAAADSDARMASASGPYGRAAGNYRDDPGRVFRMVGPVVHAAGATSANVEWHASHRASVEIAWGKTPECTEGSASALRRFGVEGEQFGSISLTGLSPGTKYYVRLRSVEPLDIPRELVGEEWNREAVSFRTTEEDPAPVTYYVSPEGDDAADGLSPEKPLRSISRVAALVHPGDTVRVAGGVYQECLYLRATGLPGRPITFSSQLGERVTLDGGPNRELFSLVVGFDKSHLRLDGFYMTNFTVDVRNSGAIRWLGGQDIRLSRMFLDGRIGWPGPLFNITRVDDLLVRNCAGINSMGGPTGGNCPRLRMENCVILRNRIGGVPAAGWASRPEHRTEMRNNIITDCQANKIHQPILPLSASDTLVLENNAYFLRPERRIQLDRGMNMAEFEEQAQRDGNLIGDPLFAGIYLDEMAPLERHSDLRRMGFMTDKFFLIEGDLKFAYIFPTNPEFIRRGIGFDPDAFRGFEAGPLSIPDLITLTDALPARPDDGFGLRYRAALTSLRDRAAERPSERLRHELREAFVTVEAARETRRDAEMLLGEAKETLARPFVGDPATLRKVLETALASLTTMLADGDTELEALREIERQLRAAVVDYDAGRLLQVRLPAQGWRFQVDPKAVGRGEAWYKPDHDDKAWRADVPIEKDWQDYLDNPYFGDAWYRRTIEVPALPETGVTVWLNFQGVDEEAWVWVNGAHVGAHAKGEGGWQVPFQLDVTGRVKSEAPNQITVMVRNTAGQGGIWKSVYLSVRDAKK